MCLTLKIMYIYSIAYGNFYKVKSISFHFSLNISPRLIPVNMAILIIATATLLFLLPRVVALLQRQYIVSMFPVVTIVDEDENYFKMFDEKGTRVRFPRPFTRFVLYFLLHVL